MLHELEKEEEDRCKRTGEKPKNYSLHLLQSERENNEGQIHRGRSNLPTANEVGAVFTDSGDGSPPSNRDIKMHCKNGESIQLPINSEHTDPMTYPLLYPFGGGGWFRKMKSIRGHVITLLHYYALLLSVRSDSSAFLHSGKLTQQFIVDAYCKMEADRLDWVRNNQKKLRVEFYKGLHDYIRGRAESGNYNIGKAVILPSTFEGSPTHICQHYQDAMHLISKFGKPDLFITFTCNPKWSEIVGNLKSFETPSDRPDLVTRVFHQKLKSLLDELIGKSVLGKVICNTFVIEWQKRGLPHAHILLILDNENKIRNADDIDKIVTAEIPNKIKEPKLFEIIKSSMIHGPCGAMNPTSPCMENGICTKDYPKKFREETVFSENGYPCYRRTNDGKTIEIKRSNGKRFIVDNRNIVPYNKYLSMRYNAHINVEICSTIKAVKYLFKYIYKGHSCTTVRILNNESVIDYNEVNAYLNARYVGPCEAFHRIYSYKLHGRSHSIFRLAVHLENMRSVYFNAGSEERALADEEMKKTTLTAWFLLNQNSNEAKISLSRNSRIFCVS